MSVRGTGAYLTPLESVFESRSSRSEDDDDDDDELEEGEIREASSSSQRRRNNKKRKGGTVYHQNVVSDDELMLQRTSLRYIDAGSFGVVYDCMLDGNRRLVLKVPAHFIYDGNIRYEGGTGRLLRGHPPSTRARLEAELDFGYEFAIGERLIDTPTMRRNYVDRAAPGQRIRQMSEEDFQQHRQEQALMRTHPGFPHVLEMVHYCPTVPCIFMSPWCDGTTKELYRRGELLQHRDAFARQTLLAMEYLHDVAGVANTDIKFANVLYQQQQPIRFILSDYGGCMLANQPWAAHYVRTTGYCPPNVYHNTFGLPVWDSKLVRPFAVSVYEYAAMLMYLLLPAFDHDAAIWCKPNGTPCVEHVHNAMHPTIYASDRLLEAALHILRASPEEVLGAPLTELRQCIPDMPERDLRFFRGWRQLGFADARFDRLEFGPNTHLPPPPAWDDARC